MDVLWFFCTISHLYMYASTQWAQINLSTLIQRWASTILNHHQRWYLVEKSLILKQSSTKNQLLNQKSTKNQPKINFSTKNQPKINQISTKFQPFFNVDISTSYQPKINHPSTSFQPCFNHISTVENFNLKSTKNQPHINLNSTMSQPLKISTSIQPKIN